MDYQRPGVAEDYRRTRHLPPETLAFWHDVMRECVLPEGIERVVDVGCGTGRFTGCLAEAFEGASVIGLDAATRMLAAADRRPRIRYVAGAAEALPLPVESVDLAFLSLVWHHFEAPEQCVAELARILRPRGHVFIRTPTREILDGYEFLRFFPESRALDDRRMPTRASVLEHFCGRGFTSTVQRTVVQRVSPGPAAYLARVRQRVFSSLREIPDDVFGRHLLHFEAYCESLPVDREFREPVDVFVVRRGNAS
jgi:ubiquinone/menaquinone biosynthesis C-methylase UbiE